MSGSALRAQAAARLRARSSELEAAMLTRAYAIADPTDADPLYREGLAAAVSTALDYALAVIELGEGRAPPPPPLLLSQARLAARSGIALDTVLRRYLAGYTLLGDFILDEAQRGGASGSAAALRQTWRGQAAVFDRLLAAVSEEYRRERASYAESSEERRRERIARLLAGEPLDTSDIDYDLQGQHLGAIAAGANAVWALRDLGGAFDCRLLLIRRDETTAWAWLGSRRGLDVDEVPAKLPKRSALVVAIGEPASGLAGWRLTHRQAAAALSIARRRGEPFARYRDVALLASALADQLLSTSLHRLYIAPLKEMRGGGDTAVRTLRAYFDAGRSVSSAAATLKVKRHTVTNRLREIEMRISRPLTTCALELETALQLEELSAEPDERTA